MAKGKYIKKNNYEATNSVNFTQLIQEGQLNRFSDGVEEIKKFARDNKLEIPKIYQVLSKIVKECPLTPEWFFDK